MDISGLGAESFIDQQEEDILNLIIPYMINNWQILDDVLNRSGSMDSHFPIENT